MQFENIVRRMNLHIISGCGWYIRSGEWHVCLCTVAGNELLLYFVFAAAGEHDTISDLAYYNWWLLQALPLRKWLSLQLTYSWALKRRGFKELNDGIITSNGEFYCSYNSAVLMSDRGQ